MGVFCSRPLLKIFIQMCESFRPNDIFFFTECACRTDSFGSQGGPDNNVSLLHRKYVKAFWKTDDSLRRHFKRGNFATIDRSEQRSERLSP